MGLDMSQGCCNDINIVRREKIIEDGKYGFIVTLVYCTGCGDIKTTSNIKEAKG